MAHRWALPVSWLSGEDDADGRDALGEGAAELGRARALAQEAEMAHLGDWISERLETKANDGAW